MLYAGVNHIAILRVKNNTNEIIESIKFIYDLNEINIKMKNIKPGNNKQTGISTIYDVHGLKMKINNSDEIYTIKDILPKGYCGSILVSINNINEGICEFNIIEED